MKRIVFLILCIVNVFLLVSCGQSKSEIKADLEWSFQHGTTYDDEIDKIIVGKAYLPYYCFVIVGDDDKDVKINWSCDTNDIMIKYKDIDPTAKEDKNSIFGQDIYALIEPFYEISILNYHENRTKYNLTGTISYKGVKFSKTFVITIGTKIDEYVSNMEKWSYDRDNNLSYNSSRETKMHEGTQGRPDVYTRTYRGTYNFNTNILDFTYTLKKYLYLSDYTSKHTLTASYNVKSKILTYNGLSLDMSCTHTKQEYEIYCNRGVDFYDCYEAGMHGLILDLDKYFSFVNETNNISIFYEANTYSFDYLFQ